MTTIPAKPRPMNYLKLMLICVVVGLIGGGVAATASALGLLAMPLAYAGVMLVGGGVGLWLSWRWWVGVDEAVREAHKTSWFWGGSTALILVGAIALGFFGITQGDAAEQYGLTRREAGLLFAGMTLTVGLLITGYGVCWAGWWFTRSR